MNTILKLVHIKVLLTKGLKGSITVEAAFSFTIMVFVLFAFLGPLLVIKTSSDMLLDMNTVNKNRCNYELIRYRSKDTKIYDEIIGKIDETIGKENFSKVLDIFDYGSVLTKYNTSYGEKEAEYRNVNAIYDKTYSNYDEETGIVTYDYLIDFNLPYNVLHINNIENRLIISRRAFIGSDGDRFDKTNDSSEHIYLANDYLNSHVYHTFIDCTYLIKHTYTYEYNIVLDKKNKSNQKYTKCDYCFKDISINSSTECFVTEYGDRFHYKSNCPLMTAYVTKAPKEYIDRYNLRLCSRCSERESND